MPSPTPSPNPASDLIAMLDAILSHPESSLEQIAMLGRFREENPAAAKLIDQALLERLVATTASLNKTRKVHKQLKKKIDELAAEPWIPAIFLAPIAIDAGQRALVGCGGQSHIVAVDTDKLSIDDLRAGDEVFLGPQRNVILAKSPCPFRGGETAPFSRTLADGRMVLSLPGEEEIVVTAAPELRSAGLKEGATIRYSRNGLFAFEAIPKPDAEENEFFLEELPACSLEEVGGLDETAADLITAIRLAFDPEIAGHYGLRRINVLMEGPPGCGKTTLARLSASVVSREMGRPVKLVLINGAHFESEYVGAPQRRIRNTFAAIRECSKKQPVVVVFDEVECLARIRGGRDIYGDKFLGSLLAELDGLHSREDNGNVAMLFLTNRKELLDPAFLERTTQGGFELSIGRPGLSASREILAKKLPEPPHYRYSPNGSGDVENRSRHTVIDLAVSLLFSPNGPNEICTVKTADGAERKVRARDLISGRGLEEIAAHAGRLAGMDEVRHQRRGITTDHMREAVAATVRRLRGTLSPGNAHAYLVNLPADMGVTAVVPVRDNGDTGYLDN